MDAMSYEYLYRSQTHRSSVPLTSDFPPSQIDHHTQGPVTTKYAHSSSVPLANSLHSNTILPIVIPQTSRALRGVYYSPFLRAYPETLQQFGIGKHDFIRFIDNLNEAFISSPFFFGITLAASAVGFVPVVAAQVVGGVVATASSFAGTANSHVRTKRFVKAVNKNLFEPVGLQVRLLSTKNMLRAVNVDEQNFALPPLPEFNAPETQQEGEDPRRRWMQALDGIVSPLDYNAPEFTKQDNWLKQVGGWAAKHQDMKQAKSLTKRRENAKKAIGAAHEQAALNEKSIEYTIRDLEASLNALIFQTSIDGYADFEKHRDIAKYEEALRQEQSKLIHERIKKEEIAKKAIQKIDKKEQKVVQKIRWIVITPTSNAEVADEDIDDGVEDVNPLNASRHMSY